MLAEVLARSRKFPRCKQSLCPSWYGSQIPTVYCCPCILLLQQIPPANPLQIRLYSPWSSISVVDPIPTTLRVDFASRLVFSLLLPREEKAEEGLCSSSSTPRLSQSFISKTAWFLPSQRNQQVIIKTSFHGSSTLCSIVFLEIFASIHCRRLILLHACLCHWLIHLSQTSFDFGQSLNMCSTSSPGAWHLGHSSSSVAP